MSKLEDISSRMKSKSAGLATGIGGGGGGPASTPSRTATPSKRLGPVQDLVDALRSNTASAGGKGLPGNLDSTNTSERTIWRITAEALQSDEVR